MTIGFSQSINLSACLISIKLKSLTNCLNLEYAQQIIIGLKPPFNDNPSKIG